VSGELSSSTSQQTEKHYFVSAQSTSQQTQFTLSVSPPLSHNTASTSTSPPPSTDEPFQLRSSSSSTSKDADRTVVEISRRCEVSHRGKNLQTADDNAQSIAGDSVTITNNRTLPINEITPGSVPPKSALFAAQRYA